MAPVVAQRERTRGATCHSAKGKEWVEWENDDGISVLINVARNLCSDVGIAGLQLMIVFINHSWSHIGLLNSLFN